MRLGHFEARRIYSGRCSLEFISKEEKGSLGIGNASPTLFAAERRCLMYRIHSASIAGVLHTSTVQPKAGRSENIYWLCEVSLLLPPSSLGLDGHGQHLSRFEYTLEVPEKPPSPCLSIGFPCTQHPSYHQPKGYWWAILGLVAAITGVFNIMGEEVLETVVDEFFLPSPHSFVPHAESLWYYVPKTLGK